MNNLITVKIEDLKKIVKDFEGNKERRVSSVKIFYCNGLMLEVTE